MWPFKKKEQYKGTWQYDVPKYYYTEIVKAYGESHARRLLKRDWPISLFSIEDYK